LKALGEVQRHVADHHRQVQEILLEQIAPIAEAQHELAKAGGEVVEDENLLSVREQQLGEVRADEPGRAGDQRPHELAALCCSLGP
jgi:hypothetical protein